MLKHRFIKPFTIFLLLLLAIGGYSGFISYWWLMAPLAFYFICISFGSYFIQLNYFVEATNKSSNKNKKIALTFDDGPLPEHTEKLLNLLTQKQVKASFFLIGKNVKNNAWLTQEILKNGHLIGSHGFEHGNNFPFLSIEKMKRDIEEGIAAIAAVTGYKTNYFRPPFGVTNPNISNAVRQLQLKVIGWSLRSYDTSIKNEQTLLNRLFKAKEGDIILLHDWASTTLKVLPTFIDEYQKKGFEFVRVDEL
jgi:peptidoglycan/xylan/chitin deacetylase (PgdA/CDA1 family)